MSRIRRVTFWWLVFAAIAAAGLYATALRVFGGLGASTGLSDAFPWGIWIGFDVLCGVGLAAGGFTVAGMVYVFRLEHYRPILRATVLTAFLGYVMVSVSLMYDLGLPYRIWHPLVMGNIHSPMFELALCVMLYTTVLFLEFAPVVCERLGLRTPVRVLHTIILPLVIFGVLLSTLHQSTLGTLYVIAPNKLHGLWYSPLLPVFFFISAVGAGLVMTIFESFLSHRAFGTRLHRDVLVGLGKAASRVMLVCLALRIGDLAWRGKLGLLVEGSAESGFFLLEVLLGVVLPAILFHLPAIRKSDTGLFYAALLFICGFVLNRMDVSITGMRGSGVYFPAWTEVAISIFIVACGFAAFALAARFLPVFPAEEDAETAGAGRVACETTPSAHAADPHGVEYVPLARADHRVREPRRAQLGSPTGAGILLGLVAFLGACGILLRNQSDGSGLVRPFARPDARADADADAGLTPARLDLPAPRAFPMGQASPGQVTFLHRSHVRDARLACTECHARLFGLVKTADLRPGGETMATMRGCAHCHDGGRAFAMKQDCALCHVAPRGKPEPAAVSRRPAPTDYAFPRGEGSPGTVTFSHARHLTATGATCSTCHPSRFHMMRPDGAHDGDEPRMDAAREGRQCGSCHNGRDAFTVASDCGLCHRSDRPAAAAPVSSDQPKSPPPLRFPMGKGSPGRVTFEHGPHVLRGDGKCSGCHPALFPMLEGISPASMKEMHAGRQCGACHNGREAFTVARDCGVCHGKERGRAALPVSTRQVAPPDDFTVPKGKGSPGAVPFSHRRHLRAVGDGCGTCHPRPFGMARSPGMRMEAMNAGRECGSCHNGRRSFTVARDCALCHRMPASTAPQAVSTENRPPKDRAYARGKGSPGTVTFSHARHLASGKAGCSACHAGLLAMAPPTAENPGVTMAAMFQGKECGHCHNGEGAFAVAKDCARCHAVGTESAASR
ncbi:MAG: Ni/Fe-hydrogenase cytochrome b subunit [Armatimonadetes bacterium]|nr:Ni/Fe-hydrogenase cytochrome b subunit [Armatimonadota bacterium]